ncbi:MAG TPA: hypothetical protein VHR47_09330 [Bacillota bacterium]|nr:hypothetical protein [Bacillota bacterium]
MKKRLVLIILTLSLLLPGIAVCHCSTPKDYPVIGSEVALEMLWNLFGGGEAEDIVNRLGKPVKKIKMFDGEFQRWCFKKGIEADIVYEKHYPTIFNYIYLSPSCPLRTPRGIRIGSSKAKVLRVYAHEINADESTEDIIVAGTKQIGLIFALENDRVEAIYIALDAFTPHGPALER